MTADLHKTCGVLVNSKLAEMEPYTIKGNAKSDTSKPQDLSMATLAGLIADRILTDGTNILMDGSGNILTG